MERINAHLETGFSGTQQVIGTVLAGLLLIPGLALAVFLLPLALVAVALALVVTSISNLSR